MYEDPIPHHYAASHYGCHDTHHIHNNNNSGITSPYEQLPLDPDQELQRLHQHQLLIQLRLEVNSLRTQIQQLELLKQQLVQQRDTMSPGEYDQMMDQFSRTSASLFSNAACRSLRHDGVSGGGNGMRSGSSTPPFSLAGLDRIPDYMSFGGSAAGGGIMGGGGGGGAPMMDRLQERLRNMTLQQQEYAQREHDQLHHQLYCQQQQQQQQGQQGQGHHQQGMRSPSSSSRSRDPVKAEQTKLEAELRDLEQRMRSIQLLC